MICYTYSNTLTSTWVAFEKSEFYFIFLRQIFGMVVLQTLMWRLLMWGELGITPGTDTERLAKGVTSSDLSGQAMLSSSFLHHQEQNRWKLTHTAKKPALILWCYIFSIKGQSHRHHYISLFILCKIKMGCRDPDVYKDTHVFTSHTTFKALLSESDMKDEMEKAKAILY